MTQPAEQQPSLAPADAEQLATRGYSRYATETYRADRLDTQLTALQREHDTQRQELVQLRAQLTAAHERLRAAGLDVDSDPSAEDPAG